MTSHFVVWLTSQQHATVSQGRICEDTFTCCHAEIEIANQTFDLAQSQCVDTEPTSPSAGVTVSMSAFLACHQCYCAGSSLAWGLNLRAVVCGVF